MPRFPYNPCVRNNHVDDNYNMTIAFTTTTNQRRQMPTTALYAWSMGCVVASSAFVRVNRINKLGGTVSG